MQMGPCGGLSGGIHFDPRVQLLQPSLAREQLPSQFFRAGHVGLQISCQVKPSMLGVAAWLATLGLEGAGSQG